jgi:hypothetical protein
VHSYLPRRACVCWMRESACVLNPVVDIVLISKVNPRFLVLKCKVGRLVAW